MTSIYTATLQITLKKNNQNVGTLQIPLHHPSAQVANHSLGTCIASQTDRIFRPVWLTHQPLCRCTLEIFESQGTLQIIGAQLTWVHGMSLHFFQVPSFSSKMDTLQIKWTQVKPLFRWICEDKSKLFNRPRDRLNTLEYIGQRGISLSGSYQQGYSTAYNTQSHIKVVCNGYILIHILN